jgi:hypothetical protein
MFLDSIDFSSLGHFLAQKFDGLGGALQFAYPEIDWDLTAFSFKGKKSEQRWLKMRLAELLPDIDIIEEYSHPDLSYGVFFRELIIFWA